MRRPKILELIQEIADHSDISTTMFYIQVAPIIANEIMIRPYYLLFCFCASFVSHSKEPCIYSYRFYIH